MSKYVLLLRGINVGGNTVAMSDLKECLESMGCTDVKTFLRTGNVVCTSALPLDRLKAEAEEAISARFEYVAKIVVLTQQELKRSAESYPWADTPTDTHRYLIFAQDDALLRSLATEGSDLIGPTERLKLGDHCLYWEVPRGLTLDSGFGKLAAKSKYRETTTRNLNTIEKMIG
ncbi:MAG: DUF1697 domain-containing protein [Armatimonadetes bacterium]|nr:DUF1697 domain-containing protein [Armatimonadota bacterium]